MSEITHGVFEFDSEGRSIGEVKVVSENLRNVCRTLLDLVRADGDRYATMTLENIISAYPNGLRLSDDEFYAMRLAFIRICCPLVRETHSPFVCFVRHPQAPSNLFPLEVANGEDLESSSKELHTFDTWAFHYVDLREVIGEYDYLQFIRGS